MIWRSVARESCAWTTGRIASGVQAAVPVSLAAAADVEVVVSTGVVDVVPPEADTGALEPHPPATSRTVDMSPRRRSTGGALHSHHPRRANTSGRRTLAETPSEAGERQSESVCFSPERPRKTSGC